MQVRGAVILAVLAMAVPAWAGPSIYLAAPDDPKAVIVKASGDGITDDTAAIQPALDAASNRGAGGIVFLPSGRYRLTRTIYIWPGVRLLGVGPTRPVLMLAKTPGFQDGVKNLVIFAGRGVEPPPPAFARKPPFPPPGSVPFNDNIADGNPGTFYPAMGNIDIAIGPGNEGTAAIRFHAAQHAYLAHMDFDLGTAFAGDVGTAAVRQYVSPDGTLALPAQRTFQQGPGWRWSNVMQTYGFITATPGSRVFVTNGSEIRTYSGVVGAGGVLTDLKPFANRGGESVAQGPDGRVYVAHGQIFVHAADGREVGRIDVPDRPLQLLFGGPDGRTLFILTHHVLYAAQL